MNALSITGPLLLFAAWWLFPQALYSAATLNVDICIYGGTSGGVVAGVQVARMGKKAVIVEPGRHLGGMTASGLSAVDIGDPRTVGGIAREYFTRLAGAYNQTLPWDQAFKSKGGPATGGAFAIEPHTAEKVFNDLVREASVPVLFEKRLASVIKTGLRITELVMEDGSRVRAGMFIDASYEGDLMAKAGVSYTLKREANVQYDETLNGVIFHPRFEPELNWGKPGANGRRADGKGIWDRDIAFDPYVIKGNPQSGVLPLVQADPIGPLGSEAPGVQAYCYRLCLTTNRDNQVPLHAPPGYEVKQYELVARFIEACVAAGDEMDLRWFSKYDPLPNGKYDFNTATFGGNLPGASWEWPEASWTRRQEIAKAHENYHRGLLYFLSTDPRVPKQVSEELHRFGLCKDEFPDTGGWPHQIYVREARRMISDLVMTEHHCREKQAASNSVGLGSYGLDIHEIRRVIRDGIVIREGKIAGGIPGPYPIGYGALVPKATECDNLLVTFALSASHVAFASIRMEPVLMVLSQSAATAASLALDGQVPVQKVDFTALQARLLADKQVLERPPAKTATKPKTDEVGTVTMDDDAGEFTGEWVKSTKQQALVGSGYRHDNNRDHGQKSARFTPEIPKTGQYEVRLIYVSTSNRAAKVPVTIISAEGETNILVNQRQEVMENGIPHALGTFQFAAGRGGSVTLSNLDTDGFVVVDAVQFVPLEVARAERAGERSAGFPQPSGKPGDASNIAASRAKLAAFVAVSPLAKQKDRSEERAIPVAAQSKERVQLAQAATPADVNGKQYDLVVVGGTASGVACAVRAAREGLTVLLVNHTRHIGGMMANALMQWDALYGGHRAPLFSELLRNIERHYIAAFGENSHAHQVMRFTHEHYPTGWAEPQVAEREFNRLVAGEKNITLLLAHYPTAVQREGTLIKGVMLREMGGIKEIQVTASTFVDATYEGDLFAVAKVPYRVGREARAEFNEPHAGVVYCNIGKGPAPLDAVEGRLNIHPYSSKQGTLDDTSSFSADRAVQAYNFRFCVCKDPANRVLPDRPANYNREEYVRYDRKSITTNPGPNQKSHMNSPILPGENHDYPEGDWPTREKIIKRHLDFALGLMYFLQNDESVPEASRSKFREWGLAADEFPDNGHIPYEMYVREARRIVGRHIYKEQDNSLAVGLGRTPVFADSIAITDWYMDSHSCTTNSRPGFHYDGKLILTEESRPGQIPYRSLLPQGVDNLLVPVCLSATHVAWGAVRLEPVWMETGEAAGYAAALAKKHQTTPAALKADLLVRTLCEARFMVSFFNDVTVAGKEAWIPAAQYFGTRGFFHDYNARMAEGLKAATAKAWVTGFANLRASNLDPNALAREVAEAEATEKQITQDEFTALLPTAAKASPKSSDIITRAEALQRIWNMLAQP